MDHLNCHQKMWKNLISEYVSLDTMLLENESLPKKGQVLLTSEFIVCVGDGIALTDLQYSSLHLQWLPK